MRSNSFRFCLFALFSALATLILAQSPQSPYLDLQQRDIKALSPEQIEALQNGDGMGYALAAELNHYPGPKHVLELQNQLNLSPDQLERVKVSFESMQTRARQLGAQIVELERELDRAFRDMRIDKSGLEELAGRIGVLQGQLRATHLSAHLEIRELLSHEQIQAYVSARGYHDPSRHHDE